MHTSSGFVLPLLPCPSPPPLPLCWCIDYIVLWMKQRPFYERWKMLEKEVIEPRNYERVNLYQCRNPYYRYDLEPFRVCIICLSTFNYIFIYLFSAGFFCLQVLPDWLLIWFKCLSGEEERLLVALYCYQGVKGVHSKAFTWIRWSYFSGCWGLKIVKKLWNSNIIHNCLIYEV